MADASEVDGTSAVAHASGSFDPVHCPYFEGQAVRAAVGLALVTFCLGLAGCSLFGKKHAAQTNNNPKPFLGSESPAKSGNAAMPRNTEGPLPGANGVLAGRVVVETTGRPVNGASIAIKNLDRPDAKEAPLDVLTDDKGFFYITRLNPGEHYELIARITEDGQLISQTVWTTPPNATLFLRLDKRWTTTTTPKPEMPKSVPDKKGTPSRESAQERTPAIHIDAPVKMQDQEPRGGINSSTPAAGPGANSGSGASPNPSNIANENFHRIPQPSVPVEIPGVPRVPPVPGSQQWESIPENGQPMRSPPSVPHSYGSVHMPNLATLVPSCGLYGNKLDNFALKDLDDKVWEYKHRKGRLTLLDFWHHNCHHCLLQINKLVELQRQFGPVGLEIVSIACETGTVEEQRSHVRPIRGRYNINYITLLSGGGPGRCPVMRDFQVEYYPCLVLIDSDGTIIWRSPRDGMDEFRHYDLKKKINERLVMQQPPP